MHRASLASRFQILLIAVLGTAGPLSAQQGGDDPILFPFDFVQGENFNPTFQEPDMTVSFLTNTAVHPEGGIRLHEGPGSSPHSGPGHLTLSAPLPPPPPPLPGELPPPPPDGLFRRGDPNADGTPDLTDAIDLLHCLFLGAVCPTCPDSADINDDGLMDLTDAIAQMRWLILGTTIPAAPGPDECGKDPTDDTLGSCEGSGC